MAGELCCCLLLTGLHERGVGRWLQCSSVATLCDAFAPQQHGSWQFAGHSLLLGCMYCVVAGVPFAAYQPVTAM